MELQCAEYGGTQPRTRPLWLANFRQAFSDRTTYVQMERRTRFIHVDRRVEGNPWILLWTCVKLVIALLHLQNVNLDPSSGGKDHV